MAGLAHDAAAPAGGAHEPSGQAAGAAFLIVPPYVAEGSSDGRTARPVAVASAAVVWHQARAKRARVAQRLEVARGKVQLQDWLGRHPPLASAAAPAAARMEALRARVAAKEQRAAAA